MKRFLQLIRKKKNNYLCDENGNPLYVKEIGFIPREGSIYFKPSFAGRNILLGQLNGENIYSEKVWFDCEGMSKEYMY